MNKDWEPKIVAFLCNWCSYAGADLAGTSRISYPANVRPIRVMCSGRVEPSYILSSFKEGIDGVLVSGCHPGDCHYISGNLRAKKNVKSTKKLLRLLGLSPKRLRLEWISASEGKKFANTIEDFIKTLARIGPNPLKKKIGKDNIEGYIVDLRNNPGGLLDKAVSVSDIFLDKGAIVLTRGRNLEETERRVARKGDLTDGNKIVVLINGGSASAAEIVAGALQDHRRASIVGTRSFGKGSVQTIIPLGANGAIRLTTARYYTPSGTSIQAKGIKPDVVIEQELPENLKKLQKNSRGEASLRGHLKSESGDEVSGSSGYVPKEKEKDTQLQYALNLLKGSVNAEKEPASADKEKKPVAN